MKDDQKKEKIKYMYIYIKGVHFFPLYMSIYVLFYPNTSVQMKKKEEEEENNSNNNRRSSFSFFSSYFSSVFIAIFLTVLVELS